MVLFGDSDLLADDFSLRKMDSPFGAMVSPMNANLNLAQNLVEQMTGDNNLIAVRSRATLNRPFTRGEKDGGRGQARSQAKIEELQQSLDDTQQRLSELQQQKKDKDQRFILSPEQQTEIENLRKKQAEIGARVAAGAEGFAQGGRLAADAAQVDQHSGRAAGGHGGHDDCDR